MKHTHKPKIVAGMVLILMLISVGPALAVHDLGIFELDRNAQDPGGAPLPDDWGTLYAGGGSAGMFTGILPDIGEGGGSQFQGGGSKDDLDITQWLWKYGEPLDKDDITNAYAAAYLNPVDTGSNNVGDLILYYGLDRFSANGSAQVGFWFLQDPDFGLTSTPSGGGYKFSGSHLDNDVLVQSNFSRGGVVDSVTVYKWLAGALVPSTPQPIAWVHLLHQETRRLARRSTAARRLHPGLIHPNPMRVRRVLSSPGDSSRVGSISPAWCQKQAALPASWRRRAPRRLSTPA